MDRSMNEWMNGLILGSKIHLKAQEWMSGSVDRSEYSQYTCTSHNKI